MEAGETETSRADQEETEGDLNGGLCKRPPNQCQATHFKEQEEEESRKEAPQKGEGGERGGHQGAQEE